MENNRARGDKYLGILFKRAGLVFFASMIGLFSFFSGSLQAQTTPLGMAMAFLSSPVKEASGVVGGDGPQRHVLQGPSRGTVIIILESPHPGVTASFDGLYGVRTSNHRSGREGRSWWGEAPSGGKFTAIVRMDSGAARRGDQAEYTIRVEDPSDPDAGKQRKKEEPTDPEIDPKAPALWIASGRNAGGGVRLHSGPGRKFSLIGTLTNGAQAKDIDRQETADGIWRLFSSPSKGWAHEGDLTRADKNDEKQR